MKQNWILSSLFLMSFLVWVDPALILSKGIQEGSTNRTTKSRRTNWDFQEIIIDNKPLQPARITDLEIVDINGDGKLDLWFSGRSIGNNERKFTWYKNTGDIHNWQRYNPFIGPAIGSAWGDVDRDGDMDLITGRDRGAHPFVWMENPKSNGGNPEIDSWNVFQIHPDPADPDEVHTTYIDSDNRVVQHLDMNRDGHLDVVIAAFKKTLWYVPGPGNPREGPWVFYKIFESSEGHGGACIGDIDCDGDLDIVWGRDWYKNPGDPTKTPWSRHIIDENWSNETQVALADLDKDGKIDVVLTGEETNHGVIWYSNPGGDATGAWKKHLVISGWEGLHSLQLADFDGDGDLDIFTAEMHHTKTKRVGIFENVDMDKNTWATHIISNVGSHKAKVVDLDRDGDPDLIGKNYGEDTRPRLWINPNNIKLSLDNWQRHVVDSDNASRYSICTGDLNRDGKPDILTGTRWYKNPGTPSANWQRYELGSGLGNAMLVHDFDIDGDLDVLGEGFAWAQNNGDESFTILTNIAANGGFVQGAALGHFQIGGPIVVVYTYKNGDDIRTLKVPSNPASTQWSDIQIYDWKGRSKDIEVGDIDRDGDIDIFFVGRDAEKIQWLRNERNGSFRAFDLADSPEKINHRCHLGDINGDGRLDAVIGHKNRLVTWFEQGNSPTSPWKQHIVADSTELNFDPLSLDLADMDHDGDLDIIVGEHTPDSRKAGQCVLYIFENENELGSQWLRHTVYTGDEHHQGTQAVDMDRDGDLDILTVGWTHSRVLLYENKAINGR